MKGVAVLLNKNFDIQGIVRFEETPKNLIIRVKVSGIKPGLHGFHIHESGDLTRGCDSLCDHYNPDGVVHGGLRSKISHRGDLGNVKANRKGFVECIIRTKKVTLSEIIGRSIILHEDPDDLGRGGHPLSSTTGNSGNRILCGVIGFEGRC